MSDCLEYVVFAAISYLGVSVCVVSYSVLQCPTVYCKTLLEVVQ